MNLKSAYFDLPRSHPSGPLIGILKAESMAALRYQDGAIQAQRHPTDPLIWYAVGAKDWWEPIEEVDEPGHIPTAADSPTISPPPTEDPRAQRKFKRR